MKTLIDSANIPITGRTYPVKDQLRGIGCRWAAGLKCWVASGEDMAAKARAIVDGQPALNNPVEVPEDLGPLDVAAEAARHGRKPTVGVVATFRFRSAKGKDHKGEAFWGVDQGKRSRYLVLRSSRPFYLSAEALEDNDDFRSRAGWYASIEAVTVEPTPAEIDSDPVAVKARKEAEEKAAKEKANAEHAARVAANQPRLAEIAAEVALSERLGGQGGMSLVYWDGAGTGGIYGSGGVRLYAFDGGLVYCSAETDRKGPIYADGSGGSMLGRYLAEPKLAAEALRLAGVEWKEMD